MHDLSVGDGTVDMMAQFRAAMRAGKTLIGPSISFADPLVSDALADSVDFLWVDLEHATMSPEALAGHLLVGRARHRPVLVRVPGSATHLIKSVLDAGANGITVPQVRDANEVRSIVADCRYPPVGRRGFGPRVPGNYGRNTGPDYVRRANEAVFVSVQIENADGLAALDDILAVPGLDSVMIGSADLSGALGVLGELDHPAVLEAVTTIIEKARAAGVLVGAGMGPNPDYAARMIRCGVQWIQMGGDSQYLHRYFEQMTGAVRSKLDGTQV